MNNGREVVPKQIAMEQKEKGNIKRRTKNASGKIKDILRRQVTYCEIGGYKYCTYCVQELYSVGEWTILLGKPFKKLNWRKKVKQKVKISGLFQNKNYGI